MPKYVNPDPVFNKDSLNEVSHFSEPPPVIKQVFTVLAVALAHVDVLNNKDDYKWADIKASLYGPGHNADHLIEELEEVPGLRNGTSAKELWDHYGLSQDDLASKSLAAGHVGQWLQVRFSSPHYSSP